MKGRLDRLLGSYSRLQVKTATARQPSGRREQPKIVKKGRDGVAIAPRWSEQSANIFMPQACNQALSIGWPQQVAGFRIRLVESSARCWFLGYLVKLQPCKLSPLCLHRPRDLDPILHTHLPFEDVVGACKGGRILAAWIETRYPPKMPAAVAKGKWQRTPVWSTRRTRSLVFYV